MASSAAAAARKGTGAGGSTASFMALSVACHPPDDSLLVTEAIDIDVERNMLTVKAERRPAASGDSVQMELSERPLGVFSRQVMLADTLDTEHIEADYDAGVLTLRIPIAERAKPRKIAIGGESGRKQISG
ncbi:Hsp20/alpha crystallin family protein [Streptomyces virginiae]|uniref:Hsp20/alpha crystallin family protein n=1 Tax=Streptomyces TaxID=1883 RepID=UPI0036E54E65